MKRRQRFPVAFIVSIAFAALLLTGCAGKPMALNQDMTELDTSAKSIVLFTLKTSNQLNPNYQPNAKTVGLNRNKETGVSRLNFAIGESYAKVESQYYEYLVSISLVPGSYELYNIHGTSTSFLIKATFFKLFEIAMEIEPDSIVYIGHIDMVNRKKVPGEPASGMFIPIIDQSTAGYSTGTFDVTISDRYEEDVVVFVKKFPMLDGREIKKAMLKK